MTEASTPHILIYTAPNCPDCRALKNWLLREDLAFDERDLSDPEITEEAKARTGVRVAPITIINDEVFYGTFESQKPALITALRLSKDV
ncbi:MULTISPECIES: glutaredoxin family protein [unclassified Ensifer]|uniref:glutaredoxin family protein n=1 Tax=unclassified Ensifer TaxID=2633371 RepID=UPI0008130894|nr:MULTISPECIES: glutaredoxin family protein [unclassified Ensifer]OCP15681.1 NrdH-redoxin [Ensifer sp. LC163]OCP19225.1 NrdH-redoxin [Ensifer sp. LC54]OCP27383.1 NrdH-redoxin [Ensifer sp. LC384]